MIDFRAAARDDALRYGIDPAIFLAQINQESGFRPYDNTGGPLTSSAGAIGIAQIMPATAKGWGVDPSDPLPALDAAAAADARYLAYYKDQGYGDRRYDLVLAAYNAGGGAVNQYGGIPPYPETQRYVANILAAAGVSGSSGAPPKVAPYSGITGPNLPPSLTAGLPPPVVAVAAPVTGTPADLSTVPRFSDTTTSTTITFGVPNLPGTSTAGAAAGGLVGGIANRLIPSSWVLIAIIGLVLLLVVMLASD